jgi:hypothetical protein
MGCFEENSHGCRDVEIKGALPFRLSQLVCKALQNFQVSERADDPDAVIPRGIIIPNTSESQLAEAARPAIRVGVRTRMRILF